MSMKSLANLPCVSSGNQIRRHFMALSSSISFGCVATDLSCDEVPLIVLSLRQNFESFTLIVDVLKV